MHARHFCVLTTHNSTGLGTTCTARTAQPFSPWERPVPCGTPASIKSLHGSTNSLVQRPPLRCPTMLVQPGLITTRNKLSSSGSPLTRGAMTSPSHGLLQGRSHQAHVWVAALNRLHRALATASLPPVFLDLPYATAHLSGLLLGFLGLGRPASTMSHYFNRLCRRSTASNRHLVYLFAFTSSSRSQSRTHTYYFHFLVTFTFQALNFASGRPSEFGGSLLSCVRHCVSVLSELVSTCSASQLPFALPIKRPRWELI